MHFSWTSLVSAVLFVAMNPWAKNLLQTIVSRMSRYIPLILALAVVLGTIPLQAQRRYSRGSDHSAPPSDVMSAAVAKFAGTLRVIGNKEIVIEAADDQLVTFHRSKKTRFLLDEKSIKPQDIPVGSPVTVEASKDSVGDLIAVDIIWKKS